MPQAYAAFAVPLGATTKMDGCAAIYPAISAIFVAEFYHVPLDLADYVLGHFSKEEQEQMEEGYEHAVCAVKEIVTGNIEAAMNEYNRKKKEK